MPSARDVFFDPGWEKRRAGWASEEGREYGSNLARLETAPELSNMFNLNLSSRRLYDGHEGHRQGFGTGAFAWIQF